MIYSKKNIAIVMAAYFIIAVIFYGVAYDQICYTDVVETIGDTTENIGELHDGDKITQTVSFDADYMFFVGVKAGTFGRKNSGQIKMQLIDESGKVIAKKQFKDKKIADNSIVELPIRGKLEKKEYTLEIEAIGGKPDDGLTLYMEKPAIKEECLFNGDAISGSIAYSYSGGNRRFGILTYAAIVAAIAVVLLGILFKLHRDEQKTKSNAFTGLILNINRYRFLIKQLVQRDFKSRYKRSVLGVCWSLLQPLLMMTVQYFVFSTIFRGNIKFYPVYLLSASVMFSFFTDSVGAGLLSIVGNSGLISKVYVPKYIYPVTKVFSTIINLVMSLIPLAFVMIVSGATFTKALLLIPFDFLCLLTFCIGMSFLLSASMVFFRDTQFIWSILAIVWMYATPLFYPANIIPDQLKFILIANPMYHYITFFRTILMDGISPNLSEYVICIGFSAVVLAIGVYVFKKTQDKFILYI